MTIINVLTVYIEHQDINHAVDKTMEAPNSRLCTFDSQQVIHLLINKTKCKLNIDILEYKETDLFQGSMFCYF